MYSARKSLAGGIVFDSHEFDYVTWLLGPVNRVHGFTKKSGVLEIETEDVAVACLDVAVASSAALAPSVPELDLPVVEVDVASPRWSRLAAA